MLIKSGRAKSAAREIIFELRFSLSVLTNNYLKSKLRARKYSKCMKTWHEALTSGYCSRELKRIKFERGLLVAV